MGGCGEPGILRLWLGLCGGGGKYQYCVLQILSIIFICTLFDKCIKIHSDEKLLTKNELVQVQVQDIKYKLVHSFKNELVQVLVQ